MFLEFLIFAGIIIVIAALAIFVAIAALSLWTIFATLSVRFSRLAISLLISAGILFTEFDLEIFQSGFLNFLVRFAIVYGIIWIASFIPRLEPAIGTLCSAFISLFTTMITLNIGCEIVDLFTKPETPSANSWWYFVVTGVCITIVMVINWIRDIDRIQVASRSTALLSMPIFVRIGRILASIIYGFIFSIIVIISTNGQFAKEEWQQYIMLGIFSSIAYIADLFLFDRAAPKQIKKQQ